MASAIEGPNEEEGETPPSLGAGMRQLTFDEVPEREVPHAGGSRQAQRVIVVQRFPQLVSLLSLDPHLPGALPPDRRAPPLPASRWLHAAPPLGKGFPFPRPHPDCAPSNDSAYFNHSSPVSTETGQAQAPLRAQRVVEHQR